MTRITSSEFAASFPEPSFPLAVAVSGGADSLALLLLAHDYAKENGSCVIALTVDHGLRKESAQEAIWVKEWAKKQGIEHVTLKWEGEKPSSSIQKEARKARFQLLTHWCKQHGFPTLLLGHHQQDQEETFWLRLSAGSGLTGLAGINPEIEREGVRILRPCLNFSKERLCKTLREEGLEWLEDPSNDNPAYFRGRIRTFLKDEGLTPLRLSTTMGKLRRDADFIAQSTNEATDKLVTAEKEGYLTLDKPGFSELHPALQYRVLERLLAWFSDTNYPPRGEKIVGILEKLKSSTPFTAGGIYWVTKKNTAFLFREPSAVQGPLCLNTLEERTLWDHRFYIEPNVKNHIPENLTVAPLGNTRPFMDQPASSVLKKALSTYPAIWEKGSVVAVPHLWYNDKRLDIQVDEFFSLKDFFYTQASVTKY